MAKCHQCNKDLTDVQDPRTGACKVCFAKDRVFCDDCAMWELGPLESGDRPLDEVKKSEREIKAQRQVYHRVKTAVSTVANILITPEEFLETMGDVCPFFKKQLTTADATLYGKQFKKYAKHAIETFHKHYPSCKYDHLAIQILIAMHLSSQERVQCRADKDTTGKSSKAEVKYLKRWQTRTIASEHLKQHLDKVEEQFGKRRRELVEKKSWLSALKLDELELYLKRLYDPTIMALHLEKVAGKGSDAREALEVAAVVYHVITASRDKATLGNHWSCAKDLKFEPYEALGFVSPDYYDFLYGKTGDGSKFSDKASGLINKVWTVLDDNRPKNKLPSHPRYRDASLPGDLPEAVQEYLQYLPKFDTPANKADERTECEKIVRKRIVVSVKDYAPEWLKTWPELEQPTTMTKEKNTDFHMECGSRKQTIKFPKGFYGIQHVRSIKSAEDRKIVAFVDTVVKDVFDNQLEEVTIKYTRADFTSKSAKKRQDAREINITSRVKELFEKKRKTFESSFLIDGVDTWDETAAERLIDKILDDMKNNFYVDQAFDDDLAKAIFQLPKPPNTKKCVPMAWFPYKLRDFKYSQIFPECGFRDSVTLECIDQHYADTGGSSPRPAHYMDWRNHKDIWLYDCFPIPQRFRPLFCSLSVQPYIPEPNPVYGEHELLFKIDNVKNRCIYTFGDRSQPVRSLLLLLDILFYGRDQKDRTKGKDAETCFKLIDILFFRLVHVKPHADTDIVKLWKKMQGLKTILVDASSLFECQVFGPIDVTSDFQAVVIKPERIKDAVEMTPKQMEQWIKKHYSGVFLQFEKNLKEYPSLYKLTFKVLGSQEEKRFSLFNKKPEDHATL